MHACPAGALDVEGKTDMLKCLRNSQPFGVGGSISFWSRYSEANTKNRRPCSGALCI
jgi:hypothetical protein